MSISMKTLVEATGENKSTIHYYLKEGLLPEPEKPKPNVHHYDESCINIIKFIKYLQNNFSYTISEIKSIFDQNNIDFDNSYEMLINSLAIVSGSKDDKWYSKEEFLKETGISEQDLIKYKRKEYIAERAKGYSEKEVEMIQIIQEAKELGLNFKLFDTYVKKAKELAELEFEIGAELLASDEDNHHKHYELLFKTILSAKPYIFNMQTVLKHQEKMGE